MKLFAQDCSPFEPQPTDAEAAWLSKLAVSVKASDLVIPFSSGRDDDEPVVYCDWDGKWWAGRYVGSMVFEGHSLVIQPRLGLAVLRNWLSEITSIVLTETQGRFREDESFIIQLLAIVWSHGFVEAARHGLPSLRKDVINQGATVRGRLDVRSSLRLIALGGHEVISIRSEKNLDHAVSEALMSAYGVLRRWLPDEKWLPKRAKELIPQLLAVTGARPRVPTKAELDRVRYTPITMGFAPIAELSRQIANRRGLSTDVDADGKSKGMLLDVAELWEMYVLSVLKKAMVPMQVKHGTREKDATKKLLSSDLNGQLLGTLIPDAILYSKGDIYGIVDAKYKRIHPTASAPQGPQREDLYQMTAYLGRFVPETLSQIWGVLAYPIDPKQPSQSPVEQSNPWSLDAHKKILFVSLPHDAAEAVSKLRIIMLTT